VITALPTLLKDNNAECMRRVVPKVRVSSSNKTQDKCCLFVLFCFVYFTNTVTHIHTGMHSHRHTEVWMRKIYLMYMYLNKEENSLGCEGGGSDWVDVDVGGSGHS
jgi:hypothetical protein